jgi:hypothetical protein
MTRLRLRSVAAALCAVAAIALAAGCGDDEKKGDGGALGEALSYLPKDTPFVFVADTDLKGAQLRSASKIVDRFPFGTQLLNELKDDLIGSGVDFDREIKPLLGNEFVVGSTSASAFVLLDDDPNFIGAIKVANKGALDRALKDSDLRESGGADGAKVYTDEGGDAYGVDGDVLVVAGDRKNLDAALGREDGLSASDFEDAVEGLPEDAAARAYFDIEKLLAADPDTRDARRIPYVAAMGKLGLAASVKDDRIDVDLKLDTSGGDLEAEDLPLVTGAEAPRVVVERDRINFAIREPRQVIDFAQAAARAIDPDGFADFERAKAQIKSAAGVDLDADLVDQFKGDLSVSISPLDGGFTARGVVVDPRRVDRALRELAPLVATIAEGAGLDGARLRAPRGDDGLYLLTGSGGTRIVYGIRDDRFVISNDAARLRDDLAPDAVAGAKGSVAISADAQQVANAVLDGLGINLGRLVTGALGDLTGSVETTTDQMRGRLTLSFD